LVGAYVSPTLVGASEAAQVGPFAQLSGQLALAHTHEDVPTSESEQDEPEGTLSPHEPQPAIGKLGEQAVSGLDAQPVHTESHMHNFSRGQQR